MLYQETVYVNEHIYKYSIDDGKSLNLMNGIISTYDMSGANMSSIKSDGEARKIKKYIWAEPIYKDVDMSDLAIIKVAGSYIDEERESYYSVNNISDIERLAKFMNLPMPIGRDLDISFFGLNHVSVKTGNNPIIASVKYNAVNEPFMLKLYRGNYSPTEQEIADAKAYWADSSL
jgi:hypothetical protein